jgi:hypothetical protein
MRRDASDSQALPNTTYGIYQVHALVVIGVSEFAVQVYDPARGERLIPRDVFHLAWKLRRHLTILIER